MQDIIYIFVTFGLVVVDIVVALLYADAIQMLLEKDLRCVFFFLMWIGILLLQTGLFSWLPGRTGSEISMLDGLIVFEDGALVRNFGSLLFVHAAGIGMSIAKNLWEVIRRRARFYGKLFDLRSVRLSRHRADGERIHGSFPGRREGRFRGPAGHSRSWRGADPVRDLLREVG